jgi:hypothetical protein
MNVELKKLDKFETKDQKSLKEADKYKSEGDFELKTSIICCKFKPNCEDAIPYYNQAINLYHAAGRFQDEIYCREKLCYCFRYLKSAWEEGNQHEKIAFINLDHLEKNTQAMISIQNAYQSFFVQGDYKDAVNSVKKMGHQFLEKDEVDLAERCLKIAYDAILAVFHTLATKKDEPYDFLYTALDDYIAILFKNNKVRIAIEVIENALKVIDQYEENKSQIAHVYGFLLISLIVNEDEESLKIKGEQAKSLCDKNSDVRFIENIINLHQHIKDAKENQFRDGMIEINVDYPIEVAKKLNNAFIDAKEKLKNSPLKAKKTDENSRLSIEKVDNDDHIVIVNDREGDDFL